MIDKQECWFCEKKNRIDNFIIYGYDSIGDGWYIAIRPDDPYYNVDIKINYCPICGRKLK